ncbi:MAG: hypothetical protein KatS3mg110_3725 [Pirellulaceae bacterium]|nr:MAG: hypothetical protein KatS3mg110_3725 [Pirellulaceae bacterium]
MTKPARVLVLGAHPDDAEFHAGGLLLRHGSRGATIRIVSVTNGAAGHHRMHPLELAVRRRHEAQAAGRLLKADYQTWDYPDGELEPSLELRRRLIREIRHFQPDLVLTHRPYDYHPDHRAVGQAVQDACYMVTVPLVAPDSPHLESDPVVAFMCDLFTRPVPLRPDVIRDVTAELPQIVRLLACHESQVFEFLPYNQKLEQPPCDPDQRLEWLREWYLRFMKQRMEAFREAVLEGLGDSGKSIQCIEVYEICQYARKPTPEEIAWLFP